MSISVITAEDGYVVLGTEDPILARSVLIEALLEREELDNFGVCQQEDKGFCDLKDDRDLCQACVDFLNTIFPPSFGVPIPTMYWKEL